MAVASAPCGVGNRAVAAIPGVLGSFGCGWEGRKGYHLRVNVESGKTAMEIGNGIEFGISIPQRWIDRYRAPENVECELYRLLSNLFFLALGENLICFSCILIHNLIW